MGNAQHSCKTAEHYTPAPIIKAVRKVLGEIDTDPASCPRANEIVQAAQIYTALDDGLTQPWGRRVYLNPPAGLVRKFWNRAVEHAYGDGVVLWAGYSNDQLGSLQKRTKRCPQSYPHVTTSARIKWIPGEFSVQMGLFGEDSVLGDGNNPTHYNYFCLMGGSPAEVRRFGIHFGKFGYYRR